tara:strand:+ start:19 stop:1113 length:1095 start_codon:yes stop_codon:yes gene_type:complete
MNLGFPLYLYYIGLLILVLILTKFIFTRYLQFARNFNLVNDSNQRSAHKGRVITGGGMVLATVLLVAVVVLDSLEFVEFTQISPLIGTSILIAAIGFYDDFNEINAFQKYIILTFLVLMTVYSSFLSQDYEGIITNLNGFLGMYEIGVLPGFLFTTFVYLSIMNSINLTDGIDGYLAIFSIFFFISFLFNNSINGFYTLNTMAIVFLASFIMYLRFNFSKRRKLFMGDAGSLFIGFWIAHYLIIYITTSSSSDLATVFSIKLENFPVLAISMINMPVLDTLRVMLVRILNKKSPFSADRNHLHHIILDKGISHLNAGLLLSFLNWFNCIIIFLLEQRFESKALTIIYILLSIFWFGFFEYLKRR